MWSHCGSIVLLRFLSKITQGFFAVCQRLVSFVEDNLLKANGNIQHHGQNVTTDEEETPSFENMIIMTWLRLIHADFPALVKQRYCTELRS